MRLLGSDDVGLGLLVVEGVPLQPRLHLRGELDDLGVVVDGGLGVALSLGLSGSVRKQRCEGVRRTSNDSFLVSFSLSLRLYES